MGHESTGRHRAARATLGVFAAALFLLASVPAQAAPVHARKASLDIPNLNHACGAAVDSKGDVYASSAGESKVKVFNPAHTLLTQIEDANTPCGLAVTTTGVLYVSEKATGEVVRFKPNAYPFVGIPSYEPREVIDSSTNAKGIAVDPFDNRLYVAEGTKVAIYKSDGSFEANAGEGTLTEATGVAPYSYQADVHGALVTNRYLWVADTKGLGADRLYLFGGEALKLRRELDGKTTPDGSFGFGSSGAYLAEDPGNFETFEPEINVKKKKCVAVGAQACSAGHLFLYDAEHKALDEFDASGEYLNRTAYPGFADAEPTAVAIDRSGSEGHDGTIYVTAGAGSGAQALAFAPLSAPKREALPEPLSHELEGARAVATDSHGDVYAGTGTEIHIYGPDGSELTTPIEGEDIHEDIAVDSTGNVYVLDKHIKEPGRIVERIVTYYTPSKYPPDSETTYSLHEPPIITQVGNNPRGIAVNPGPGPGKDRLLTTGTAVTSLYDSAANGSTLLDPEFAKGLTSGLRESIAVYGATGTVYIGVNDSLPGVDAVDETGKERLAHFNTMGSPSGESGANPSLAVDQSDGHVVEYDGTTGSVHEYDAAGSFVAEFGSFSKNLPINYRVAVDNACAIHVPPLDETTTPTCKAFDPANGTAYVAFADTKAAHPPFDVTAFGRLKYGSGGEKFPLSVLKSGTGSGKVTSIPAGIDCGVTCSADFEEGKVIELTQEAASGSEFVKWSGPCSGSGACKVAVSEAKSVTAEFKAVVKAKLKLTVSRAGTGSGTVTSSPAGINCAPTCSAEYDEGTEVTLSASPEPGSVFGGWSGSGCSGTGTCKVTMSAAKSVTATFTLEQHQLSVTKEGSGTGTVTSSPAGIDCGLTCSASFDHGATVTLTATSGAKTKAVQWAGCGSVDGENKCLVTMSGAKAVTATFDLEPTPKFKLTVSELGAGSGTVTSSPAGINCAPTCNAEYDEGTEVTLSASPEAGSTFSGWSGSGCSGTGTCKVTMSAAKSVTATFDEVPKYSLTVSRLGAGSGTVTSIPSGINCGSQCSAEFEEGKVVTLSQTPASGSEFRGWSGACSGTGACEVTMSEAKSVSARFANAKQLLTIEKNANGPGGTGTVSSKPKGIKCGAACSKATASLYKNTTVELTAKPTGTTSTFSGWVGCDSISEGKCIVSMTEAKRVEALFGGTSKPIAEAKPLTLQKAGSGEGTVKAAGLACEAACTETQVLYQGEITNPKLKAAKVALLTATAAYGSSFTGWSGCKAEPEGNCEVEMKAAHSVTASFAAKAPKTLVITKNSYETGTGTVSSKPKGIKCATTCTTQAMSVPQGETIILTEKPATGMIFTGWEVEGEPLACAGAPITCAVKVEAATAVKATFSGTPKAIANEQTLTLSKSGDGTGNVKASGLACEAACTTATSLYAGGTEGLHSKPAATVTLEAIPSAGSAFTGWSGCDSEVPGEPGKPDKCVVMTTATTSLTASFDQ
jgi:hypothetical protein